MPNVPLGRAFDVNGFQGFEAVFEAFFTGGFEDGGRMRPLGNRCPLMFGYLWKEFQGFEAVFEAVIEAGGRILPVADWCPKTFGYVCE